LIGKTKFEILKIFCLKLPYSPSIEPSSRKALFGKCHLSHPKTHLIRKNIMTEKKQDEFLEEILLSAESLKAPPRLISPIPKQWLPAWLRWPLKLSYLPVLMLDLLMQKLAKLIIRPPFKQTGTCKRRGNCCYYILLPEAEGIFGKVFYFWQTQVNGFFLREKSPADDEGKKMLIMGCRYLKENGSCGSYRTRPSVCRRWPIIQHFGRPRVLKGCGYNPTLRKSYQKEPYLSLFKESTDSKDYHS